MSQFFNCKPIYNAFGKKYLNKLPILHIGNKMGGTGCIDFIQEKDIKYPIMIGFDCYHRPFISLKVLVKNNKLNIKKYIVGTFFQKNQDNKTLWAFDTCYENNIIYNNGVITNYDNLEKRLKELLDGKCIKSIKKYKETDYIYGTGDYDIKLLINIK